MAIYFEGQVHRVQVHPGPDGKARFEQQIRELLQLEDDEDFDVEFECRVPQSCECGAVWLEMSHAADTATCPARHNPSCLMTCVRSWWVSGAACLRPSPHDWLISATPCPKRSRVVPAVL